MKSALVFSQVAAWPKHHAETVELVNLLAEDGYSVTVLVCKGELRACASNPHHKQIVCFGCKLQSNYSKAFNFPNGTVIKNLQFARLTATKIPDQFASQTEFESFHHEGVPVGRLALAQLMDEGSEMYFSNEILNSRGRLLVGNAVQLYEASMQLFSKSKFDKVFVWNGRRDSDGPVLFAARKNGIEAFAHEGASTNNRYIVFPDTIHSMKNWNYSISEFIRNEAPSRRLNLEIEAEAFYNGLRDGSEESVNFARFGDNFESQNRSYFQINHKKNLTIFSSSVWEAYSFPEYGELHADFLDPYNLIMRICEDKNLLERFNVCVRWHPNLQNVGTFELKKMKSVISSTQGVKHYLPEDSTNSYNLLDQSDVIITTGSTMGIEAAYCKKVSILAGIASYSELGSVYKPRSLSELLSLLNSQLVPLENTGAVWFGAWARNFGTEFKYVNFNERTRSHSLRSLPLTPLLPTIRNFRKCFKYVLRFLSR